MKCIVLSGATVAFHELVEAINEPLVKKLNEFGYNEIEVQYGHAGSSFQKLPNVTGFDFDVDLKTRVESADLVITHAGAGSILESLDRSNNKIARRKILVVVNQALMGNHQLELALKLEKQGCIIVVQSPKFLLQELVMIPRHDFKPFPPPVSIQGLINEEIELSAAIN